MISVGSLNQNKNHLFLIDVIEILYTYNKKIILNIAGEGNQRVKIEKLIDEKKLKNNIILLGNINSIEGYLWQSSIYVHAAKSEAFGLTLIEAMAAGLPVITLDGKGNRDLIEQGKNGYMVFEESPPLFAEKIIELWEDNNKYQLMSQYASQYAKQFDIKPYIDKLLYLYNQQ